jgi:outer membrane protein assembly factor BamB
MAERIRLESGSSDCGIDFSAIIDTVDILIDGSSVSAAAPPDAVFLMIRDLLAGCEALATCSTPRVALPFYESPWELVVRRDGNEALISFYQGGMNPRVEIKDSPVGLPDLVHALVHASERLVDELESLNPNILAEPFIGELLGGLERLRAVDLDTIGPDHDAGQAIEIGYDGEPARHADAAFAFSIRATGGDILAPTTPNRSDLYSLMASGTLTCLFEGQEIMIARGRPVFMIESLVLTCRHILSSIEEDRDLDLTQDGESLRIETRFDSSTEKLTVSLIPAGATMPAILSGIGAMGFVDAVLVAARDLRRQVFDVNPTQRTNLKFDLLAREVDTLTTWRRDLTDPTIVNTDSNPMRYELPRQTLPRTSEGADRLIGARKLMYTKLWEAEAEGLRLDATFLCGQRLIVSSASLIAALQRQSGEIVWRRAGLNRRALAMMTGETGLLIAGPEGDVSLVDVGTGKTLWSTRIPPAQGKPGGIVAGGGRRPRYAVLTTGESGLTAVDLFTGEARWRFTTRRGLPSGFAKMGRLLAFTCRSNSVYCLDVDTGELVWRLSERARFDLPPVNLGEVVAVWMSSHANSAGRVLALDGLTGEVLWAAPVKGRPLCPPVRIGTSAAAATSLPGATRIEAFRIADGTRRFRRDLEGVEGPVSLLALDANLVVHCAQGLTLCIEGSSGKVLWSRQLTDGPTAELPLSLEPVLRDGGLFVPLDTTYVINPADGTLLHRLDSDSPVPDLLRVDEQYSIYTAEISGHVGAYGVVGHLNVVRS